MTAAVAGVPLGPWAEVAETHSAAVFFAGDWAYKLKKPVSLGFLDFTTRQARAAVCAREVELNRLSALVRSAVPVAGPLRQMARILAIQHARAARGPQVAKQGGGDALRRRWVDNIEQTRQILRSLVPRELLASAAVAETQRLALRFLPGGHRCWRAGLPAGTCRPVMVT